MIRGGTYEIEIQIKDTNTGNPIDLTNVTGILVGLYGEGRRLFGKWSYVDKSTLGFGDVTITNAINGIISVALQSTDSLNAIEKICKLEVLVTFNNPMFDDNLQISIDTDIILEKVERSIFEGVSAI
jgi:hypothetical protein